MNPIPEIVKRMITKDPNVINRMKTESLSLSADSRIWTFPPFKPIDPVVQIITEQLSCGGSNFEETSRHQQMSPTFGFNES